jgi:voltage-gated potassium channel
MDALARAGRRIDHFLHEGFGNEDSPLYHAINRVIVGLILLSVVSVTLASVRSIYEGHELIFDLSEVLVVTLFTIEYAINIYVAPNRKKYLLGPWGIIDLLAILPSILLLFDLRALKVTRVLRILRFLRLLRILRVLKLAKVAVRQYEKSREQRFNTLKMDVQIYLIALLSVITIFSTLAFYAEEEVANTAFTSIPAAMWWCIVTITTTGYGDMVPATVAGRVIAGGAMLSGLALFSLLMNVVGKTMLSSLFGSHEIGVDDQAAGKPALATPQHAPHGASDQTPPAGNAASSLCACGAPLAPGWRLCPYCGKALTRAEGGT